MTINNNTASLRYATAAGVRTDIRWLYEAWMKIRDTPLNMAGKVSGSGGEPWDRFALRLHAAAGSDAALRAAYGFEGCVFGAGKRCPASGPVRCKACRTDAAQSGESGGMS